jgi:hypothetical protein
MRFGGTPQYAWIYCAPSGPHLLDVCDSARARPMPLSLANACQARSSLGFSLSVAGSLRAIRASIHPSFRSRRFWQALSPASSRLLGSGFTSRPVPVLANPDSSGSDRITCCDSRFLIHASEEMLRIMQDVFWNLLLFWRLAEKVNDLERRA